MANYVSAFISGTVGDAAALESALEDDLPVQVHTEQATASTTNTTSSDFAAIATESGIAVESDETLLIIGQCDFSGSAAGDGYEVALFVGSTELKRVSVAVSSQTGTGGNKQNVCLMKTVGNLSGTVTVTMQHRRSSGSGTLYATRRDLDVIKFKNRA